MKVLVAEDDANTREGLIEIFQNEGYQTVAAENGEVALAEFRAQEIDVVCLDVMMPDVNGYDVCREIRQSDPDIPILFISAKAEEVDKVLGLELGADDYIVKPFGLKEVVARIRAVTRRRMAASKTAQPNAFDMRDLRVVPAELRVYRGETVIELSLRDMKILSHLHDHAGCVVDRDSLFDVCWGLDYMPNSRALDQHISQLRKRIERDPSQPEIIKTVHGAGYRYDGAGA